MPMLIFRATLAGLMVVALLGLLLAAGGLLELRR